jgi:energy-coupling factor transporter ATP-binding protein EcfA2
MTAVLQNVAARLMGAGVDGRVRHLVLAAFAGGNAVDALLANGVVPEMVAESPDASPVGAYITSISVEGFRGIGPGATLELSPGPGLTLVVGRNGSGKSSFAEAFEVLLTGDNQRWTRRSAVWREGWRNLHHPDAAIEADLVVEDVAGVTSVRREWAKDADIDDGVAEVQPHGKPRSDLRFLGWEEALLMHRPFLSYNELGAMLDEGPTKLHDAIAAVLGLEDLADAEKALRDARLARQRAVKEVMAERDEICALLESIDDERAGRSVAALRVKEPALEVVEDVVRETASSTVEGVDARLRRVTALDFPSHDEVERIASELLDAQRDLAELAGTHVDRLLRSADLLERAVALRETSDEETCPVCETPGVLTDSWLQEAAHRATEQRAAAREATRARDRAAAAEREARGLISSVPAPIRDARELLDVDALIQAWARWIALEDEKDTAALAAGLRESAPEVGRALEELQAAARAEIARREDTWRPVALALAAWLGRAREARERAQPVADLKKAEAWLKKEGIELRNERFAPIAEEALAMWRLLRQDSNVELGRIEFEGTGTRRRVTLDVTVDGVEGAALGVMSQGELHALALSLFFPRATLDESPFRFIIIDDPVQSMDPAKVDGLAKVLERAAEKRQVIVFTHDDRLPEAVRRLRIPATVLEVTRREESVVEVRSAMTPVERHIEDARALTRTQDLPDEVARRVVPGFCRLALEAASIASVRRRRIGRGERHADVEEALSSVSRLTVFVALALFDDGSRGGEVLGRLQSVFGSNAAATLKAVNVGAHEPVRGDLRDLVRDTATLARQLAEAA